MRITLVLHGKAAREARVRAAVVALRGDGHDVKVRVTWEAGDAGRLTAEAVEEARRGLLDSIVAGGGDGTVNEVFSAAYSAGLPPGCSLGILPQGTANDFARSVGIPVDDPTAAMRLIVSAPAHIIDLGVLQKRPFVNLLSGGFGSRVTAETDPELKRRLGGLAYLLTGVARFKELAASHGRFRGRDFTWEGPFLALAIGNGRQAGGGIPLCPDALIDDGLLDLTILPELPAEARLESFGRILREGIGAVDALRVSARSPWFEFEGLEDVFINLDGEPMRAHRFRVECRPKALPVHIGSEALLGPAITEPERTNDVHLEERWTQSSRGRNLTGSD